MERVLNHHIGDNPAMSGLGPMAHSFLIAGSSKAGVFAYVRTVGSFRASPTTGAAHVRDVRAIWSTLKLPML